jgi:hypothetical protein
MLDRNSNKFKFNFRRGGSELVRFRTGFGYVGGEGLILAFNNCLGMFRMWSASYNILWHSPRGTLRPNSLNNHAPTDSKIYGCVCETLLYNTHGFRVLGPAARQRQQQQQASIHGQLRSNRAPSDFLICFLLLYNLYLY